MRINRVGVASLLSPRAWLTPSSRPVVGSIGSSLYGQAVLIVTGVLAARALGPTDRGYLAFILLLESIVRQVGSMGLPVATTFFVARDRAQAYGVVRTLRTPVLGQVALLTVAQAVLLWIFLSGDPQRVWLAGLVTLALVPLMLGQEYALALLQGQGRFRAYNILRALPVSGYAVILVPLYLIGGASLVPITIAYLVPFIVFTPLMLYVALRGMRRDISTDGLPSRRRIFHFGLKSYLGGLSPVETFRLDQSAIGLFLSPKALGLYVVALSFTNLPRFIALSVGAVAFPRAAHDLEVSGRRTMWRFALLITALTAVVVVPLELLAGWLVPFFFGADFSGAVGVTRILLIGAFFFAIRRVLSDGAKGIGLPGLGSIAELGSWISLVALLVVLMPPFGLEGVAAAIAISSAFSLAILVVALLRTSNPHDVRPDARREAGATVRASSP